MESEILIEIIKTVNSCKIKNELIIALSKGLSELLAIIDKHSDNDDVKILRYKIMSVLPHQ
ncbi:MAG: hypothetical protein JZD41_09150 [Thermoproteus sp.]|nr:hypothetical protein [Thermoproteus sp.]